MNPSSRVSQNTRRGRMNDSGDNFSIEDIKIDTFPAKTYHMIESCDRLHPHVACWTREGDAFVVKDSSFLSASYIPKYFKHSNFQSFVRQLNLYGFRSSKPKDDESSDSSDGAHYTVFRNENFRKGRRELLRNIQRSKTGDRSHRKHRDDEVLQDITNSLSKIHRVEDDVSSLHDKIDHLASKLDQVITLLSLDRRAKLNPPNNSPSKRGQAKTVAFEPNNNNNRRIKRQRSEYGMETSAKSNLDFRKTTELLKRSISVPSIFKGVQRNGADIMPSQSFPHHRQQNQTVPALPDNPMTNPLPDEKMYMNMMMRPDAVNGFDVNTSVTHAGSAHGASSPADTELISDGALEQVDLKDGELPLEYADDPVSNGVDDGEPIPLDDMMQMDFGNLVRGMEEGFADDVEATSRSRPKRFIGGKMGAVMTGCMLAVIAVLAVTSASLAVALSENSQKNSPPSNKSPLPGNSAPQGEDPKAQPPGPPPASPPSGSTDTRDSDGPVESQPETISFDPETGTSEPLTETVEGDRGKRQADDELFVSEGVEGDSSKSVVPSASPTVQITQSFIFPAPSPTETPTPGSEILSLFPSISLVPTPTPLN